MAKSRTVFYCQECGAQSSTWIGKCPSCGEWNTYIEEVIEKDKSEKTDPVLQKLKSKSKAIKVNEIVENSEERILINDTEFNRVTGGGIVPGSVILVGGEPGIGKSTLLLQIALKLSNKNVLYVTGEESISQIHLRAKRLNLDHPNCFILNETSTHEILKQVVDIRPGLIIIDSIQTLQSNSIDSTAGSISQIRECASELQQYAKLSNIPVVLIGHITKEGSLAGPKVLEHMVDTVLQFEGDRNHVYRILRATKNRFGSTSELGIYEMTQTGLREIPNPSEIMLSQRNEDTSGIATAATIEGVRPLLIETQALVGTAAFGTPQRSSTGFDSRRLNMLLAVLEKRGGFRLASQDVFLNIAGGIKVDDPAIDLAVAISIISSYENMPVPNSVCLAGEIGLSGEIRAVSRIDQRIQEAAKQGFETIITSKYGIKGLEISPKTIQIVGVSKIEEVFQHLFG